jgi:hypothetical protein
MWKSKEIKTIYMRERRNRFISNGCCSMCGKNLLPKDIKRCDSCRIKQKNSGKAYYAKNPEVHRRKQKIYRDKIKIEVFNHYGRICQCCGETITEFLTIDHINNDGAKERRENGGIGGQTFYIRLKKLGFPPGYQVLCFNCNCSKGVYGYCPHKSKV